jgi:hypothetical protein
MQRFLLFNQNNPKNPVKSVGYHDSIDPHHLQRHMALASFAEDIVIGSKGATVHTTLAIGILWMWGVILGATEAKAQESTCIVPVFRGAAQPQGAEAEMRVVNNGRACGIRTFGNYPDTASLAHSGSIVAPPKNGKAKFEPPRALYTPAPGFVGDDYFEFQANANGPQGNPVYLRVRVKVSVAAP